VRTAQEFAEGHVAGARNLPHTEIAARLAELEDARDRDVVVYCRSGRRSEMALEVLRKAGFTRLFHLEGDWLRWSEEKRPAVTAPPQP
jgi:rhodanese-related sulfurtransferase